MESRVEKRWSNYYLAEGDEFENFWRDYLTDERDLLIVMGLGFDPRSGTALKKIVEKHQIGLKSCHLIKYEYGTGGNKRTNELIKKNENLIESVIEENSCKLKTVSLEDSKEDLDAISYSILKKFDSIEEIRNYTDIVLDISSLPRNIYYPLLNKLCQIIDDKIDKTINLHVVATENPKLDSRIQERGLAEEASYIPTLSIKNIENTSSYRTVWIPILGEGQEKQIEKLNKFIEPAEISPVLPFPAKNLRRGDNLVNDYQKVLFGNLEIELSNIIYSDESNPFQTYRNLISTFQRYKQSFEIIGGCKIIVSALSSKLLSIGAFLAVYEAFRNDFQIGIAHVQAIDYELNISDDDLPEILEQNKMYSAWITGEPYN